jgi:hypothetical protein
VKKPEVQTKKDDGKKAKKGETNTKKAPKQAPKQQEKKQEKSKSKK